MIVFSNKAYNAIIRESFDKDPVETGGILLGHILDNGVWIVIEVLPPGIKCIFERAYFEYDDAFVNYLAQSVANQYKIPLELLGLWHRHPDSMDVFSSTDDGTNTTFAQQNPNGVISGLVNIDPRFRLTMYHMDNPGNMIRQYNRPNYERIEIEVGDDIIPEEYFQLKYYDGEDNNLNPIVERSHTRMSRSVRTEGTNQRHSSEEPIDIRHITNKNLEKSGSNNYVELEDENSSWINDYKEIWALLKKNKISNLIALILVIASIFSIKTVVDYGKSATEYVMSWFSGDDKKEPCISKSGDEIILKVGGEIDLRAKNLTEKQKPIWKSSDNERVSIDSNGKVIARKAGPAEVALWVENEKVDQVKVIALRLSKDEIKLNTNESDTLKVEGLEERMPVNWSTDNNIVTVDNGVVTASNQEGQAKITAKVNNNQSLDCCVSVERLPEVAFKIKPQSKLDPKGGWLYINYNGGELSLSIEGKYDDNVLKKISWKSSNEEVATIEEANTSAICKIKFIGIGNTEINLCYKDNVVGTYKLELRKKD